MRDATLEVPYENIALIGQNGTGKSTLLRLIAGTEPPTRGRIKRSGRVSWPLGLSSGFAGTLSGLDNVTFLARVYGQDTERVVEFVEDFAELGPSLRLPWNTYSSGMRARLAFSVSMAIDFDYYLIDEITAVGDAKFRAKCHDAFLERRARSKVIMVSHSPKTLRDYCNIGIVMNLWRLEVYDDIEEAIRRHQSLMNMSTVVGDDDDDG